MLFHMICWGMCCNCCRCCCFRKDRIAECSFARTENRKWWILFAVLTLLTALGGAISIFINSSTTYEKIDTTFDHVVESLQDGENFLCRGFVPDTLRSEDKSIDQLREQNGGNDFLMTTCSVPSIGSFLNIIDGNINATVDTAVTVFTRSQDVLTSLNVADFNLSAALQAERDLKAEILLGNNRSREVTDKISLLRPLGLFSSQIPQVDYYEVSDRDINSIDEAIQFTITAQADLNNTINSVSKAVSDLQNDITTDLFRQRNSIISDVSKVDEQLLNVVSTMVDFEDDVATSKTEVNNTENFGEPVIAVIFGLSIIFLGMMLLGYFLKKKLVMCIFGYLLFGFFAWMCFALGLILVYSMINYDVCGCESVFTAQSCSTLRTIFKTNVGGTVKIGSTEVDIQKTIENILLCPDRNNATGFYDYSNDSNFIDILGIGSEFNKTTLITPVIQSINEAALQLDQVDNLNKTKTRASTALDSISSFDTAFNVTNVTAELNAFLALNESLAPLQQDENDANWPVFYSTATPASNEAKENNTKALEYVRLCIRNIRLLNETTPRVNRDLANTVSLVQTVVNQIDVVSAAVNATQRAVEEVSVSLFTAVAFIQEINRFSPCGWVGNFYTNVVISDFCEATFTSFDSVSPGAIACLAAMLVGFFVLVIMRDLVDWEDPDGDLDTGRNHDGIARPAQPDGPPPKQYQMAVVQTSSPPNFASPHNPTYDGKDALADPDNAPMVMAEIERVEKVPSIGAMH
ncbi:hypothetical protein AAMO2058_000534900 [Amorphochlora amoebiformis]